MAIRSLLETVACRHIIQRRGQLEQHDTLLKQLETAGQKFSRKLQAMRKAVYEVDDGR